MDAINHFSPNGSLQNIISLIKQGANVNYIVNPNHLGWTPLIKAVIQLKTSDQLGLIRILLNSGANINERNIFGSSPLSYAVMNGNVDLIKFLINKGSNANDGWDSLYELNSQRTNAEKLDMIKVLVESGANINYKDKHDLRSPLDHAIYDKNRLGSKYGCFG